MRKVKFAVIGGGTSGLTAMSYLKQLGEDFVLIQGGAYGTTCARVGCMPSKAIIHAANHYHQRQHLAELGIENGELQTVDMPKVLQRVRQLRDRFTGGVKSGSTDQLSSEQLIEGYAKFVAPNQLEVNGEIIEAERIIIANGSRPVVPAPWKTIGDKLWTSDEIFEQQDLPKRIAVIGLGVIGLELGQALARLGIEITGIEMQNTLGGLSAPEVVGEAVSEFSKEFDVFLGQAADVQLNPENEDEVMIKLGEDVIYVDAVLASLGRRPNNDNLNLQAAGITLDERGMPQINLHTSQIEDTPIFIAGDVNGFRQILHEAGDEGRMAVLNAVSYPQVQAFARKTPLGAAFTDPQIAMIGKRYSECDAEQIESVTFKLSCANGRAIVMNQDKGAICVYADKVSKKLLGAELFMADAEHIAHSLAWMIEQETTVADLLRMPFYHPVLEEALQSALRQLAKQLYTEQTNWLAAELSPLR